MKLRWIQLRFHFDVAVRCFQNWCWNINSREIQKWQKIKLDGNKMRNELKLYTFIIFEKVVSNSNTIPQNFIHHLNVLRISYAVTVKYFDVCIGNQKTCWIWVMLVLLSVAFISVLSQPLGNLWQLINAQLFDKYENSQTFLSQSIILIIMIPKVLALFV